MNIAKMGVRNNNVTEPRTKDIPILKKNEIKLASYADISDNQEEH